MITKNAVYSRVAQAIKAVHTTAFTTGKKVRVPASWPAVWIIEFDTYPDSRHVTLGMTDSQRISVFEVQAFSNKQDTATTEVASIMAIAEATFRSMGYVKITHTPIDDDANATVYRELARFRRIIGGADTI